MTHINFVFSEFVKTRLKKNVGLMVETINLGLIVGLTLVIKFFDFSDLVKKRNKITKIMRVWAPKLNYEILFIFPDKK